MYPAEVLLLNFRCLRIFQWKIRTLQGSVIIFSTYHPSLLISTILKNIEPLRGSFSFYTLLPRILSGVIRIKPRWGFKKYLFK
jgi:hypothetical protein